LPVKSCSDLLLMYVLVPPFLRKACLTTVSRLAALRIYTTYSMVA
jgi:hypothetical protein